MASADLTVLRFIPEATIGVTPATPALKQLRFTSESLNYNIENTKTAEIRPDRTETDLVQTSAQGGGEISFELSYGSFKEFMEAALCGTWTPAAGVENLDNGTIRRSFTIQKHFQDMTTPQFHTYRGCVIDSMSLNMEIGQIVQGSFSVMAFGVSASGTQIAGATYVAAPSTVPMNAVANVQNLTIDGVPYSGCISSLSMQIKNNVRPIQCIGSIQPTDMKLGTIEVTGNMEFYFNEASMYGLFVNGTEFDFSFDLIDSSNNKYTFQVPRAKFETGQVVAGGRNTDVMFSASWRALYDSVTGRVIRIVADPA